MKDVLVSQGLKLITTNKNSNKDVYVFEYNPKEFLRFFFSYFMWNLV